MMKILIINPLGIGDVIFSTPIIEILHKHFPGSYIGYICNRRASDLLETDPRINKIFIYEKDDYRQAWHESKVSAVKKIFFFLKLVKSEKFNMSIDLSLTYQYSMCMKFIGIKKRIGLNYRNRGKFLTDKVDIEGFEDKHVIEYYLDLLRPLGIDVSQYKITPKVYLPKTEQEIVKSLLNESDIGNNDILVGIIPGCGASWGLDAKYRRWLPENFAKVADDLVEKNKAKIILFGDKKDIEVCAAVRSLMKHKSIMACGKTAIKEFLSLTNKCKVIVTNDGGPLHIAVGLGVSTVSIFGPVDENVYGPYPKSEKHTVVSKNDVKCRPCYKKFKYDRCENRICLDSITVDEVYAAAEKALKR